MDTPGSEKSWRTDGIEPTYVMDDPLRPRESIRGWQLGGTFALEEKYLDPLVAWCEFVPRGSKNGSSMLATFHLHESSPHGGQLRVWKILDQGSDGRLLTEQLSRERSRQYFDRSENLGFGDNASPILSALDAAAKARSEEDAIAAQREREQDPHIALEEEISDVLWAHSEPEEREEGRRELRALFDRLPREAFTEIAVRIAYSYLDAADELSTLQGHLDDAE